MCVVSADAKLLTDLREFLIRVREELDGYIDIRDGDAGEPPVPNWAMSLCSEIDGNDYAAGLLERLDKARKEAPCPE